MADTEPQPDPPSGAADALTAVELSIAERRIAGGTMRTIAPEVNLSPAQVCRILQRPHVDRWITSMRIDAQEAIRSSLVRNAPAALATLLTIMRNDRHPAAVRLNAAIAVLDRTLPKAVHLSSPSGGPVEVDIRTSEQARELIRGELAALPAGDLGIPEPDDDEE